jgi:uncharacterized PurR-regulated membrane protein YhhQ (DUF165 family)
VIFAPLAVAYVALVILANWLASRYTITVPFTDYLAPAGVVCIGVVLVIRDWLAALRSFAWFPLMLLAGGLSYAAGFVFGFATLQRIAVASVCAFLVSETAEGLVFAPLRRRHLTLGVALSASVGNVIDSALFLWLAFGSEAFLPGNVVGKAEAIGVGVALTAARRTLLPIPVQTDP